MRGSVARGQWRRGLWRRLLPFCFVELVCDVGSRTVSHNMKVEVVDVDEGLENSRVVASR